MLEATYAVYLATGESKIVSDLTEALQIWNREPQDSRLLWADIPATGSAASLLSELAEAFGLHPLAVEDAEEGHQRTKFERYGDSNFMVLRPASSLNDGSVLLSELEIFAGPGYLITARHIDPPKEGVAHGWHSDHVTESIRSSFADTLAGLWAEDSGSLSATYALLHRVLDAVVDSYGPILDVLEDAADDQEDRIFSGTPTSSQDIYTLSRSVLELDKAIKSLPTAMQGLTEYSHQTNFSDDMLQNLRDVSDHVHIHVDRLERLRSIIHEIFSANSTLIAERQGDQTKKISAWAGILFIPSLIAGLYGMNFTHMPELHWLLGYPFAILLMLLGSAIMYAIFKYKDWV